MLVVIKFQVVDKKVVYKNLVIFLLLSFNTNKLKKKSDNLPEWIILS